MTAPMRLWLTLWLSGFLGLAVAQDKIEVTFQYEDSLAREVAVVGDFSQGRPIPLTQGSDRKWTCRLALKPGRYAYKFLVNGEQWVLDPANPARVTLNNFEYSALTVGDVPPAPSRPAVGPPPAVTPTTAPVPAGSVGKVQQIGGSW